MFVKGLSAACAAGEDFTGAWILSFHAPQLGRSTSVTSSFYPPRDTVGSYFYLSRPSNLNITLYHSNLHLYDTVSVLFKPYLDLLFM